MEMQRLVPAIIIPLIAFAAVAGIAFGFGMFLHVFPHGMATFVALLATLSVTLGAAAASAAGRSSARR